MTSQRNALSTFQQDSGHSRKLRAQSASPGAGNSVSAVRVACPPFAGSSGRTSAGGAFRALIVSPLFWYVRRASLGGTCKGAGGDWDGGISVALSWAGGV